MKPTYFGANVRIAYRGPGIDKTLIVQKYNALANAWLDARVFDHTFDHAFTDARLYAAALADALRRHQNARKILA